MTANQIAYVKSREEQRANMAREVENHRTNVAQENERKRADDLSYEASLYASRVNELNNIRSTAAQQYAAQLNYNASLANVAESQRHNRATEEEQNRHNVIGELQTDYENRNKANVGKSNILSNVAGAIVSVGKFLVP